MNPPRQTLVLLAFAAIYVIWGSTYLVIRVGIETIPPFLMAGVRFLLAGLPFYAWLRWRGVPAPSRAHWGSAFVVGGLMMFGGNGLVTWAEQYVPSAIAAVLIATVPLWMALLHRIAFGGSPLSRFTILGLCLGFAGVVILVGPSGSSVGRVDPIGAAVLVLASLFWALGSLHSRRAAMPASPLMAVATQMIGGGLILLSVGSATGEWAKLDVSSISTASLFAILYLIVFGSIVALSAYVWLLRVTSPAAVSTYAFVNPVVAVILGSAFGGEHLSPRAWLASSLIVLAVGIILIGRRRQALRARRAAEAPALRLCEDARTQGEVLPAAPASPRIAR